MSATHRTRMSGSSCFLHGDTRSPRAELRIDPFSNELLDAPTTHPPELRQVTCSNDDDDDPESYGQHRGTD